MFPPFVSTFTRRLCAAVPVPCQIGYGVCPCPAGFAAEFACRELAECVGDLSLAFVGGVKVDHCCAGGAVAHAGHQLAEVGPGVGS